MGGVEKALLRRGEQTQIQRWLRELHARDFRIVVVGPPSLRRQIPESVPLVQESPAFAGPAAGVLAGATELLRGDRVRVPVTVPVPATRSAAAISGPGAPAAGWTLLLAVDLTEPAALLDWLLGQLGQSEAMSGTAAAGAPAAVLPCDAGGRRQYLSTAVPTDWLLRRTGQLTPAQVEHRPLRWLLQGLEDAAELRHPILPRGLSDDVDTVEDAHRLGISLP